MAAESTAAVALATTAAGGWPTWIWAPPCNGNVFALLLFLAVVLALAHTLWRQSSFGLPANLAPVTRSPEGLVCLLYSLSWHRRTHLTHSAPYSWFFALRPQPRQSSSSASSSVVEIKSPAEAVEISCRCLSHSHSHGTPPVAPRRHHSASLGLGTPWQWTRGGFCGSTEGCWVMTTRFQTGQVKVLKLGGGAEGGFCLDCMRQEFAAVVGGRVYGDVATANLPPQSRWTADRSIAPLRESHMPPTTSPMSLCLLWSCQARFLHIVLSVVLSC